MSRASRRTYRARLILADACKKGRVRASYLEIVALTRFYGEIDRRELEATVQTALELHHAERCGGRRGG